MRIANIKEFHGLVLKPYGFLSKTLIPKYRLLALDVGIRRVGVACYECFPPIGNSFVYPMQKIDRHAPRFSSESLLSFSRQLQSLVDQQSVVGIVAGFPLLPDEMPSPLCEEIISLIQRCNVTYTSSMKTPTQSPAITDEKSQMICTFWDERNSTVGARTILRTVSGKRAVFQKYKDSIAASLIMQGFVDHNLSREEML